MSTLQKKRVVDQVLTNIARGFFNASHLATKLFPMVSVTKEGGKIPQFTKEAFKIYNTERAIRAKSNRINPESRETIDYVLTESDGSYSFDDLPSGVYRFTVTYPDRVVQVVDNYAVWPGSSSSHVFAAE